MTRFPGPASFRAAVRARSPLIGTFLNLGSALAAEACAVAGFDWLLVDLEHGGRAEDGTLGQLLAASAHGIPTLVRVETAERIRAGRVLDLGVCGVMFPRLDTVEEVRTAICHLRYPPAGDRGVATYNRAYAFGLAPERLETAGDSIVAIVQIESVAALDAVEAIAATPDVDVLFVGPRDLSQALGIPGQFDDSRFQGALERVARAAETAGIAAGILASSAEDAIRHAQSGFTFIGIGSDSTALAFAGRTTVGRFRAVIPAPGAG